MVSIKTIFTNIANAIRTKKGTSAKYLPENMAEEISTIETGIIPSGKIEITNTEEINVTNYATAQIVDSNLTEENIKEGVSILGKVGTYKGSGDNSIEDGLITGEISGDYSNDRITKIKNYAFQKCKNLTSVSFPNVTSIGNDSFRESTNLTNVNMPKATSIGDFVFYSCKNLTNVSLPNVTSIGAELFRHCTSLTSVSFPNVTRTERYAFAGCSSLTSISLPNATSIGYDSFQSCSSLTSISLPNATSISDYAFEYCYSLIKLVITQTDRVCTLGSNIFIECYHFLGTVNSTYNPEGLKDGRIYVPDRLVDSYKSETNWSAYADIIVPLSTLVE